MENCITKEDSKIVIGIIPPSLSNNNLMLRHFKPNIDNYDFNKAYNANVESNPKNQEIINSERKKENNFKNNSFDKKMNITGFDQKEQTQLSDKFDISDNSNVSDKIILINKPRNAAKLNRGFRAAQFTGNSKKLEIEVNDKKELTTIIDSSLRQKNSKNTNKRNKFNIIEKAKQTNLAIHFQKGEGSRENFINNLLSMTNITKVVKLKPKKLFNEKFNFQKLITKKLNNQKAKNDDNNKFKCNSQIKKIEVQIEETKGDMDPLNASISEKQMGLISDYNFGKVIGKGSYAIVKEAFSKINSEKLAIKIYNKKNINDEQKKICLENEISILQTISHSSLLRMIECIEDETNFYLVTEFITGKSLSKRLKEQETKHFPENIVKQIFKEIVSGIAYCHSFNISHRDIKLENIIMDDSNKIKIIDFGFATKSLHNKKLNVLCGTPTYMSPEIANKRTYLGPPADVWALGILFYALLTGKFPFLGINNQDLFKHICHGKFKLKSLNISNEAKDLIGKMLTSDPLSRPSAKEVEFNRY